MKNQRAHQESGARRSLRFAIDGATVALPREYGLDVLEWLGLGRPEFGAIAVGDLAARCRRRLWPMARNVEAPIFLTTGRERPAGLLAQSTRELLELAERSTAGGVVLFG